MKSINLNDNVKVKLTPLGAEIYYNQNKDLIDAYPQLREALKPRMPKIDSEGYTEFQLHHFISLYGEHIGITKQNVIDPLNIYFEEDVLE